jgi:hypothetical protein
MIVWGQASIRFHPRNLSGCEGSITVTSIAFLPLLFHAARLSRPEIHTLTYTEFYVDILLRTSATSWRQHNLKVQHCLNQIPPLETMLILFHSTPILIIYFYKFHIHVILPSIFESSKIIFYEKFTARILYWLLVSFVPTTWSAYIV